MLYIYLLSMNAHPIHILLAFLQAQNSLRKPCQTGLLAFLQAQNSLRKPCQTGKRTIWQDIGDKKADGYNTYLSIPFAKPCH